jgi:hypothetical protein
MEGRREAMMKRLAVVSTLSAAAAIVLGAASAAMGVCGPFLDVSDATFCPFVLEIFTLGITTGTTPTTYDPSSQASRLQMAAFLSRTVDQTLRRGGRRAALRQLWVTKDNAALTVTFAGSPRFVEFDGADLWVSQSEAARVSRIRASDGKLLETWTGVDTAAEGVLIAMGKVLVAGQGTGRLYRIDPSLPAGAATTVATGLPTGVFGLAFDGGRVWTSNLFDGSVSIVTPAATLPWTVTTTGVFVAPTGILYDGSNIWLVDSKNTGRPDQFPDPGTISKLSASGGVLQTITLGVNSGLPVFDGTNIWVPNTGDGTVSIVRASSGAVLATLTGSEIGEAAGAAFDGERVLVTNAGGNKVSLWKAANLTPLGSFPMPPGSLPLGACSDGVSFWVALLSAGRLARF